MTTIRITVKNEVGREFNPYAHRHTRLAHAKFEETVKTIPAPCIPDTKDGETIEAELYYQERNPNSTNGIDWQNCIIDGYDPILRTGWEHRLVYCLIPQQPKEQEKEKTAEGILDDYLLDMPLFGYVKTGDALKAIEAYTQQTAIKDTRISELERALTEIRDTVTKGGMLNGSRLAHIKSLANNALKVK